MLLTKEQKFSILIKKYDCYVKRAQNDGFMLNPNGNWKIIIVNNKYELSARNNDGYINPFSYFFFGKTFNPNVSLDDFGCHSEIEKKLCLQPQTLIVGYLQEMQGVRGRHDLNSEFYLSAQFGKFILNKYYGHGFKIDNSSGLFF